MQSQPLEQWAKESLEAVGLVDWAVYKNYLLGILSDNTSREERKDAALTFLQDALPEKEWNPFVEELITRWEVSEEEKKKKKAPTKAPSQQSPATSLSKAKVIEKPKEEKPKALSKEEQKRRQALLEQYGYQIEHTDENGDIVLCSDTKATQEEIQNSDLFVNTNSARIAREQQLQREKAREKHQQKVQRDKENQAKEIAKKEKRKKQTQKQEKRRGFG
jgi:hypothetical protein